MNSVEMGTFPLVNDSEANDDCHDIEERVNTTFGSVKVSIYGDRAKLPIVTFHDIGLDSDLNFQNFFQFGNIAEFSKEFCVYNINAPGQETDAHRLPEVYQFPGMDGLARIVECVVDHFDFKSFVGLGVGAGANVLLRYALNNSRKLISLILINCDPSPAGWIEWGYQKMNISYLKSKGMTPFTIDYLMWHHFGKRLDECNPDIIRQYRSLFHNLPNPSNVAGYIESYLNRTPILISRDGTNGPMLNVPVMQIVGSRSPFIDQTVLINECLDPSKSDWIKFQDSCGLILDDSPEKVAQSMVLFLQGLGYLVNINVQKLVKDMNNVRNGIIPSEDNKYTTISEE
uniref:Protein NDRG3 n=1 Tax=Rhabditophanes sp. KR3021 TaxID=114890 RepID=A0AC35TRZ5_9BILA